MNGDSEKVNIDFNGTEASKATLTSEPQVLPAIKKNNQLIQHIVVCFLALLIPMIVMWSVSYSSIDAYKDMVTQNISTEKSQGMQDIIKSEEELQEEKKKANSFSNVLRNYIFGNSVFNSGIVKGLIDELDDVQAFSNRELHLNSVFFKYFDPFFSINVSVAQGDESLKTVDSNTPFHERMQTETFKLILFEYILRFGLASLAMFCLASRCMRLNEVKSLIVSIIYSLSSIVILFASNSSIMNVVVVLPLVMWAAFKFQFEPAINTSVILASSIALMTVTGIYGLLFGVPFVLVFILFVGLLMSKHIFDILKTMALGLVSIISGIFLSMPVWLSYIGNLEFTSIIADAFTEASMRYTLLDFLYRFLPLSALNYSYDVSTTSIPEGTLSIVKIYEAGTLGKSALNTNLSSVPSMYMSVLALVLLVGFFINRRVSLKAKVCAAVVAFIYHLSYAFIPFDAVFNMYDMGTILGSVRFIFLHGLLCFMIIVALGLFDNDRSNLNFTGVLLVSFAIVSNALFDGDKANSFKMIFGVALPLIYYFIFVKLNSSKFLYTILAAVLVGEFCFVTNVNFKTSIIPVNYLKNPLTVNSEKEMFDTTGVEDIMLLNGNRNVLFTTLPYADETPENLFDLANAVYKERFDDTLFEEMMPVTMYTECMDKNDKTYTINDSDYAKLIATFDGKKLDENSRVFIYSEYPEKCHWMITNVDAGGFLERGSSERGPFIRDITDEIDDIVRIIQNYGMQLEIDLLNNESSTSFNIGIYILDKNKVDAFNSIFADSITGLDGSEKVRVITNVDFREDLKASIDLRGYDTYNFCGKIAFDIDSAELNGKTVRISDSGGISLVSVILESVAWAIILVIYIYSNREKKVEKKEEIDIQHA